MQAEQAEPSQKIDTKRARPQSVSRPTFHPEDAGRPRHASPAAAARGALPARERRRWRVSESPPIHFPLTLLLLPLYDRNNNNEKTLLGINK